MIGMHSHAAFLMPQVRANILVAAVGISISSQQYSCSLWQGKCDAWHAGDVAADYQRKLSTEEDLKSQTFY